MNKLFKVFRDNNIEFDGEFSYMGYDLFFILLWNKCYEIIVLVDILKLFINWCEIKMVVFKVIDFWGYLV